MISTLLPSPVSRAPALLLPYSALSVPGPAQGGAQPPDPAMVLPRAADGPLVAVHRAPEPESGQDEAARTHSTKASDGPPAPNSYLSAVHAQPV